VDFSDLQVISPLLNSLTAQEAGDDHGDYVLLHSLELEGKQGIGAATSVRVGLSVEESQSVTVQATPANGTYRANPVLGAGTHEILRVGLERIGSAAASSTGVEGRLGLELGSGSSEYARATLSGSGRMSTGAGELWSRVELGIGTEELPAYRGFVLGGRGTLVGEPFRAYGGRTSALAQLEWRFKVPIPAIPLGTFASTGRELLLAPFLAAGYAARSYPNMPWGDSQGVRPVAGVAVEWFMHLLRLEAGVGLRDGRLGVTVDVNRDWWGLL